MCENRRTFAPRNITISKDMKKAVVIIAAILSLNLTSAWADNNSTNNNVRTIKSPRFARPLVEKWIEEYAKTEHGVVLQIAKGQTESDLTVTIVQQEGTS